MVGSSPLTRGKQAGAARKPKRPRLIPAHAGKTYLADRRAGEGRAHPRSRGENEGGITGALRTAGSSPLTRGKQLFTRGGTPAGGLIPAHAGKTHYAACRASCLRAHPRSRGENCHAGGTQAARGGSSPLTRGKLSVTAELTVMVGLIPAHAGKTHAHRFNVFCIRAHPRSRGENLAVPYGVEIELGSSPLTRGKHFLTCTFIAQIGQILESLELCASFESYSLSDAYATDAPRDRVRSIGLAPPSSRAASSA